MALVRPNLALKLHLDIPETTCKSTPSFQPFVLPACRTNTSCKDRDVKSSSELEKLHVLGHGNGGTVYKVRHKKTGSMYALKVFHGGFNSRMQRQEFAIFSQTDCPHVVGYRGVFEKADGDIEILMEYMDSGTLDTYIKTHGVLSEDILADFARQVLEGFKYLHSKKIAHHNIKPDNLLINQNMEVKISDFGVSETVDQELGRCTSYVGTYAYMSPERFDPDSHGSSYDGYAADIWSLGLTLMELYIGRYPYLALGQRRDWPTLMCAICFGDPPSLPDDASENFKDFMCCCLQKEANRRWTASQLLQHPFVALTFARK